MDNLFFQISVHQTFRWCRIHRFDRECEFFWKSGYKILIAIQIYFLVQAVLASVVSKSSVDPWASIFVKTAVKAGIHTLQKNLWYEDVMMTHRQWMKQVSTRLQRKFWNDDTVSRGEALIIKKHLIAGSKCFNGGCSGSGLAGGEVTRALPNRINKDVLNSFLLIPISDIFIKTL